MKSITPGRVKTFMSMVKSVIEANPGKPVSISSIYKALYITSSIQAAIRKAGYIALISHQGNQGGVYAWEGGEITDDMVANVMAIYTATRTKGKEQEAPDWRANIPDGAPEEYKLIEETNTVVRQMQARIELLEVTLKTVYDLIKELHTDLKG